MSKIANSTRLFRTHLKSLVVATAFSLVPTAIVGYVCFAGYTLSISVLLPVLFFSAFLSGIIDVVFLYRRYGPLRVADTLVGDQMYAQNPALSKAVVLLQNLPLSAFGRAVLMRALPSSVICCLIFSVFAPGLIPGKALISFVLFNVSLVPVFPGIYEMLALRPVIQNLYPELLSYQAALLQEWKEKIWNVGLGTRFAILVFMLGVVPLCAIALSPDVFSDGGSIEIALTSFVVAISTGILLGTDARKSRDILLDAMRHLERNKPGQGVSIPSADEFSQLAAGMTGMIAGMKQQSFMRDSFGKFVPRAIVEAVLRNGVKLTGEHRTVALMLVEIRQFDSLVKGSAPPEVITLLNQYLKIVFTDAQHFSGTIDRVHGDSVLVVFGAPVVLDAPVERALLAALEIRKGIAKLNNKKATTRTPLRVSVSIHHGQVIAGHIGASERWEYSVIGDAVDKTHRMHEISRSLEADISVSDAARKEVGSDFLFADTLINGHLALHPLRDHVVTQPGGTAETRVS